MNTSAFLLVGEDDSSSGEDEAAAVAIVDKSFRGRPIPATDAEQRPVKQARVQQHEIASEKVPFSWTKDGDSLLQLFQIQMADNWDLIAAAVSAHFKITISPTECKARWEFVYSGSQANHEDQALESCNFPISRLCQLFISYESNKQMQNVVDWDAIGAEMSVSGEQAIRQWLEISQRSAHDIHKSGIFHPDEDKLIMDFVAEWQLQGGGKGAYTALQKLLGRDDKRISERYRHKLKFNPQQMHAYNDSDVTGNNNHISMNVGGGSASTSDGGTIYTSSVAQRTSKESLPVHNPRAQVSAAAANAAGNVLTKWSPDMDELLVEGYNQFQNNWAKVSLFVNLPNVTNEKCRKRMNVLLNRR